MDTLADTPAVVDAEKLGDTLGAVDTEALVDTLLETLAELEAE